MPEPVSEGPKGHEHILSELSGVASSLEGAVNKALNVVGAKWDDKDNKKHEEVIGGRTFIFESQDISSGRKFDEYRSLTAKTAQGELRITFEGDGKIRVYSAGQEIFSTLNSTPDPEDAMHMLTKLQEYNREISDWVQKMAPAEVVAATRGQLDKFLKDL